MGQLYLSANVDLSRRDELGELVVNPIPKSYNEDNKNPFFLVTNGELKKLVENAWFVLDSHFFSYVVNLIVIIA